MVRPGQEIVNTYEHTCSEVTNTDACPLGRAPMRDKDSVLFGPDPLFAVTMR